MSPVPTPWGEAWLSPADPILGTVVLGVSGASAFPYPLASVPPLAVLAVQSVALTPSSTLVIGAPARIVWD